MPRYLKLGIGVVGLIAVACGLFVARGRHNDNPAPAGPQPVPVTAAEVQRQDVPIVLEGVGTVQALYTATIRSKVTGTLEEVGFSEGEKVKRGHSSRADRSTTFQAQLDQANAALARDQAHSPMRSSISDALHHSRAAALRHAAAAGRYSSAPSSPRTWRTR